MTRRLGAGFALALLLATGTRAGAHAFLDRAEPRVGGKVHTPPAQITLWFTERLEPPRGLGDRYPHPPARLAHLQR